MTNDCYFHTLKQQLNKNSTRFSDIKDSHVEY